MKRCLIALCLVFGCAGQAKIVRPASQVVSGPGLTPAETFLNKLVSELASSKEPEKAPETTTPPAETKPDAPRDAILSIIDDTDVLSYMSAVEAARDKEADHVVVVFNTHGGELDAAQGIVLRIDHARTLGIKTYCVVDGDAWSAGFYIMQSCDRRYMTKRSVLMAHQVAITVRMHPGQDPKNASASLEAMSLAVSEQCARRLKITIEDYLARVADNGEIWLNWKQAIEIGAVDEIVEHEYDVR